MDSRNKLKRVITSADYELPRKRTRSQTKPAVLPALRPEPMRQPSYITYAAKRSAELSSAQQPVAPSPNTPAQAHGTRSSSRLAAQKAVHQSEAAAQLSSRADEKPESKQTAKINAPPPRAVLSTVLSKATTKRKAGLDSGAPTPSAVVATSAAAPHPPAKVGPSEDAFHARPSIKLIIPDILKAMLVDDWENVTKNNQLVPLPHPHPVSKILEDYAAYEVPKRAAGSSHVDILEETLAGLKEYFDKSLGRILLYRFERAQYADIHQKWMSEDPDYQGKTASDSYGPEHLMRLLVSLPELVAQTNMDQQSVNRLREELVKFCTWLSKNTEKYFVSHYESPTQDYIQRAKD